MDAHLLFAPTAQVWDEKGVMGLDSVFVYDKQ